MITAKFLLLFYFHCDQSLLSYFSFISFFNYYLKMVILIGYLTLKAFASLFAFIQLCFISLGVFHIFLWSLLSISLISISHLSLTSSHWELFYKIAFKISAKWISLGKCHVLLQLYQNWTSSWYFSKILTIQSAWYSVEQIFWRIFIFTERLLQWLLIFIH